MEQKMEIAKEIYMAHQRLSRCSATFLDFVKDNPGSLDRSHFNVLLSDKRFNYFQSQPWPTFVNDKFKKKLEDAAIKVYDLITSIPGRLFSYNLRKISDYYEIPAEMTELLIYGVDDDYLKSILGRGDFIFSTDGGLKCVEFNMQANMGGWELDLLEPLYVNTPIISKFLKEYHVQYQHNHFFPGLLEHVLQPYLDKKLKSKEPVINIAIVFLEYVGILESGTTIHLQNLYRDILQQERGHLKLKGNLFTCGFDVLNVVDDHLFCGDQKIDILIEMSNGKVPFLFLTAVEKGNLMLYNGPVTQLMSNKLNIALLSEHENSDLFTTKEREVIKTYIPWTRKVIPGDNTYGTEKIKLEDFLVSHREKLVLKSAEGLGGDDVYIGRFTSPGPWKLKIEQALKEKKWVIQEHIQGHPFLYQIGENGYAVHQTVWGLFVFGSRYAGGFVRLLPEKHDKGVINSKQGAEKSIILEIREQDKREESMEITKEMKEMYQGLSFVNLDFLKFVQKNPDSHRRSNFKLLELNDDLFKLQPWPTFINNKTKEIFREAGTKLFDLFKGIPGRVFNNDPEQMGAYYQLPAKELKKQFEEVNHHHIDGLVGRGDFIISPSGLKCLEYNVASSMGGWQIPIWEHMYLNHPIIARFLKSHGLKTKNENLLRLFLEHVLESALSIIPGCDTEINMAFVLEGMRDRGKGSVSMYLDKMFKEIAQQKNKELKGSVFTCDYYHLDLIDNCIFYKGNRIHALVEMYLGYTSPQVMTAFRTGNIRLINGPISFLLSNKLNLALLSDPEYADVFTGEERKIIDTYVPWTRKITPGRTTFRNEKIDSLERFMLSNRERLVIKPSMGLGGKGICLGVKSTGKEWEEAINIALKGKNWLVQELVESSPGFYQLEENGYDLHDMVWGFFVFGSRYCGAWNRVMPQKGSKGIINCHQGATVSIVFEVEDSNPIEVENRNHNVESSTGNQLEITTEMEEILEKLSRANVRFIEFVKKNPEGLKLSSFESLELNDRYYALQSWPTFISRKRKEAFRDTAINVCELIKNIPARLFNNDPEKIGAYYNLPVNLVKLQLEGVTDDHLANLVGRGDFIFTPSGLKCLEFNISANVSGWQMPDWESRYLKTPVIAQFLKENRLKINNDNFMGIFMDHIIQSAEHLASPNWHGDGLQLNAAMLTEGADGSSDSTNPMQAYLNQFYQEKLNRRSLKGSIFICDHPYLEFNHNAVYFKGNRIHAITELYHGLVPPGLIKAFTSGNLRLLNGPVTGLLSNKFNLAVLSEYEDSDLFSEEERKAIKEGIPWTRRIIPGETTYGGEKITMENFLAANKDRLVIKPSIGLGGEGVYIGQGTSAEQWETLVNKALREKNALAQELVDAPPGLYQAGEDGCAPHDTVWGTWVFGPLYGGSFVRAIPKKGARKVINAYTGARISIVFEVDK